MYTFKCNKNFHMNLNIPNFSFRYNDLIKSDKKNILIVKDRFDNTTFRYRGYNIIQSMKDNKKYKVHCFLIKELYSLYDILDKIDLVILQRAIWSFELESFINILKLNNIKIIYDIDDLIYNPKYVPKYLNSRGDYSEHWTDVYFALSIRCKLIADKCDGFIVTTQNLYNHVQKDFNKPVWIFHNYLNLEQEKVSKEVIKLKKNNYSDDKFVIGYFSGSPSHQRDLEIMESALLKLMNKYNDIYLKIVGIMELSDKLSELKNKGRIKILNFVSFEELEYQIGQVDLNVIPLQNHDFNDCKSELKYFEASIVNTISCASNNQVYKNIIIDGVDGFLSDEISWFDKIEYIYLNYQNLGDIINNARIKCLKEYGSKQQEKKLEKMYDDIFNVFY